MCITDKIWKTLGFLQKVLQFFTYCQKIIIYITIDYGIVEIAQIWGKILQGIKMNKLKNVLTVMVTLFVLLSPAFANEVSPSNMSTTLNVTIPAFTRITPITSPVLTANITNRTGNLYAPLHTTFRVITNSEKQLTLYLKANVVTDTGYEEAMFMQGGQVYIAFANLAKLPTSSALANCKLGGMPKDSPGVVAYPVTNIHGAEHKYLPGKNKYEVYVKNGKTDVTVNVGSNVLRSSFASNDPRGFYQAVLSLTEADI